MIRFLALLKYLVKFYNKQQVPWVQLIWATYYAHKVPYLSPSKGSFWWKDILKLHNKLAEISFCISGMGDTVGLWLDTIHDQCFADKFPNLFTYALNESISLKIALQQPDLLSLFRLPMSRAAHNEFQTFTTDMDSLRTGNDQTDIWVCTWNGGIYSSSQFYKHHL